MYIYMYMYIYIYIYGSRLIRRLITWQSNECSGGWADTRRAQNLWISSPPALTSHTRCTPWTRQRPALCFIERRDLAAWK